MNKDICRRILDCQTLPSLPAAAIRVLQLTNDDKTELTDLAKWVSSDPALSVKILRAVNSSIYGLSQQVATVDKAVVMLGLHSVKTLVLGFSLVNMLRTTKPHGFNHMAYWRRSMYAATAGRIIADHVLGHHTEDCFIAGLLMDIGMLVLDSVVGEPYGEVWERAGAHGSLSVVETHSVGITHAEAGGILAKYWKLPDLLAVPIANHHQPMTVEDVALKKVTEVIWLAGRCADIFTNEKGAAESISEVRRAFRELYGIGELKADGILCNISMKTAELANVFEIKMNAQEDYDTILKKASDRLLELSVAEQNLQQGSNRRAAERVRKDGKLTLIPCARGVLGRPVQVRLRDLSTCGLGFVHDQPLDKGSQFVIQFPDRNGSKTLLYTVVRCEKVAGLASMGAELSAVLRPQTGDDLKAGASLAGLTNPPQTPTAQAA